MCMCLFPSSLKQFYFITSLNFFSTHHYPVLYLFLENLTLTIRTDKTMSNNLTQVVDFSTLVPDFYCQSCSFQIQLLTVALLLQQSSLRWGTLTMLLSQFYCPAENFLRSAKANNLPVITTNSLILLGIQFLNEQIFMIYPIQFC